MYYYFDTVFLFMVVMIDKIASIYTLKNKGGKMNGKYKYMHICVQLQSEIMVNVRCTIYI